MIDIKLEFPPGAQIKFLRLLDPAVMAGAEAQALNRTRDNVRTLAIKLVAKEMGITTAKLKKRGRDVQVSLRDSAKKSGKFGAVALGKDATKRTLSTSVRGFGRPFNVSRWGGELVLPGASVSISRTGKRRKRKGKGRPLGTVHSAYGRQQFAPNTWMLKNKAIMVRDGASFRGVYGPGVTQVMEYPNIRRILERLAVKKWDQHFKSAVEFAFTARGPVGARGSRR